jgi:hypothetical protein
MNKILGNLVRVAAIIVAIFVGIPAVALFVYDAVVVRPHLAQIEGLFAGANPQDVAPPKVVRDLIDAGAGSPTPYATRLVMSRIHSDSNQVQWSQLQWHVHSALWHFLLPIHLGKDKMYGLYATLAYNGTDYGLSNFASREYGKSLNQLSPRQAAIAVAITYAPSTYARNRDKLEQRALILLKRSGYAP